jgi:diguanylate cyclase (GGDEF)-like protein
LKDAYEDISCATATAASRRSQDLGRFTAAGQGAAEAFLACDARANPVVEDDPLVAHSQPKAKGSRSSSGKAGNSRDVREKYQRLLSVQRESGLGHASVDHFFEPCWCTPQFLRNLGLPLTAGGDDSAISPKTLWRLISPADRQLLKLRIRQAAARGGNFSMVLKLTKRPRDSRWIWLRAELVLHARGRGRLVLSSLDLLSNLHAGLPQTTSQAAAELLAESESTLEVMPQLLQLLCEQFGWSCALLWLQDGSRISAAPAAFWAAPDPRLASFVDGCSQSPKTYPCQVLHQPLLRGGPALCVLDLKRHQGFGRAELARKARLRSAMAVPVEAANQVFGVIELFGPHRDDIDWESIKAAQAVAWQAGQALRREAAETALVQLEEKMQHLASECFDSLSDRRELQEQMQYLAWHDPLTGLLNRAGFTRELSRHLHGEAGPCAPFVLIALDLDRFKTINEGLGHPAGDRLLQEMARRLQASVPPDSLVGRSGGDEFMLRVPAPESLPEFAGRLLQALERDLRLEGQMVHTTVSLGLCRWPEDGADEYLLQKRAGIALHKAKLQGKNTWATWSQQIDTGSAAQLSLEAQLRQAIEGDRLTLHYQPKVDSQTCRITGCEVLVRWQHEHVGLLHPEDFIPVAEETGLIVPLTRWVLRQACLQSQAWRQQGLPPMRMAVNLSACQFADHSLPDEIRAVLQETGMPAHLLELEITESMMMKDVRHARQMLLALKALGVHIALDDFGVAYSSLSYLKRFPIDIIKIDRSFIRGIPGTRADAAITEAIITLARSLQIKVVAEGVEKQEQLQFLRDHQCDELQGFLFSQPLSRDEFFELMKGGTETKVAV